MYIDFKAFKTIDILKKTWFLFTFFLLLTLLILLFVRFVWGPGDGNPIYSLTGRYIGEVIYFTLYILGFALIVNLKFWKFLNSLFTNRNQIVTQDSGEYKSRSWVITSISSLVCFIGFVALYFRNKPNNTFIGVDGDYSRTINENQKYWGGGLFDLGINPLQGIGGNIWFPINTRSDPGYLLGNLPKDFDVVLAHIGWGTLLYLSTFYLATKLRLAKEVVICSAWLVPFFVLFPSVLQFSTVPQLIPHMSTVISLNTLVIASLATVQNSLRNSFTSGIVLSFSTLGILIVNPTFLILCLPLNSFIFLAFYRAHFKKGLANRYLLTFGIPIGVLALPSLSYLFGMFKFSAVGMFPDDFIVGIKSNRAISSFFQLPGVAMIIAISLIGMLLVIKFQKDNVFVGLAKSSLIFFVFIITLGPLYVRKPEIWKGPSPNYFEFMFWPIYGIFFSFVIVVLFLNAVTYLRKLFRLSNKARDTNILLSFIIVFALSASFITVPSQKSWEFPAKENKILIRLSELAVTPGSEFNGRQMTFTGLNLPNGISWNDLQKNDYTPMISSFGTDFRKADLWIRSIPTLTEYSQTISPISHRMLLALLGYESDKQVRNMLTLRRVNAPALAMLGVKMVVTDKKMQDLELLETLKSNSNLVFLYKIAEPNLGDYSPTQVVQVKSDSYILARMEKMDFDPKKTVFVSEELNVSILHEAFGTDLEMLRNGYRINASSKGNSILVLPIEFSSCWSVVSNDSKKGTPKLFRANYGLTGMLFSNSMNADLVYRYNFFGNQSCRLSDLTKVN